MVPPGPPETVAGGITASEPGGRPAGDKAAGAFRTIGELSRESGLPQHILRYWETRFPQLRPLQRAGNRRYYRPEDVALVLRINHLLNQEGYTIRGVQTLLADERKRTPASAATIEAVRAVRESLADALARDTTAT
ncbi:MerR family transcriptional regulator [Sphingomonas sp. H39-1-10]|nr:MULTISPECIES: MerR family transcriptional regulator [Sphingomonas]MDF0488306.1 MerR family transcriptional regulator [Sphingomonas pollutisoli]SDA36567.1 MerR HTH family regulatory protein [Sphingomonas sp. NFR15]